MKKIITLLYLACCIGETLAQQDVKYTQHMYNTQVINPAYAGSRDVFSLSVQYRAQWIGLDGSPTTQTLTMNTPVSRSVGLGVSILNDEIGNGTNQNTYFNVDFSYIIALSDNSKFSFGLKAGGHLLAINLGKLINYKLTFPLPDSGNIDKKFSPNFGAGLYYRYSNSFYAGISIPNFLETRHFETIEGSDSYLSKSRMEYYFISGFVFDLSYTLRFKPSILIKATSGAPLHADVSANFLHNNGFSFGAAYRLGSAVSALVGFQVSDRFMLGMAYDRETTALGATVFNNGSFEFFLRYELRPKYRRTINSRFF